MSDAHDTASRQSWSLGRRLTLWVTCCVVALLLIETALAAWFVRDSLRRELDALSVEEAAELEIGFLEGALEEKHVVALIEELNRDHPEVSLSARVWRAPYAEPWVTAGSEPRIPWSTIPQLADGEALSPERTVRVCGVVTRVIVRRSNGTEHQEAVHAELMVDGIPRERDLDRTGAFFLLITLVAGALTILVGILFANRLTRLLEKVAESASVARLDGEAEVQVPERAPEEIRQVAEAFAVSIQKMRSEHSRNVLLTAGLAHELGAPLQNLISEAEVGLLSDRSGPEYRRMLASQLEDLRALALVVDNLITLTALRDHRNLPRGERFDLAAEARMRLSHEEHEAARRNVTVQVEAHGDCTFCGDREVLVLMLRNLVGNAVRWTEDDSIVSVVLTATNDSIELVVADRGPGVPEGEADAIFEAFYQGQVPRGTRAGYGLGLALARAAARSEGGEIVVLNREGGGAQFLVSLPKSGV